MKNYLLSLLLIGFLSVLIFESSAQTKFLVRLLDSHTGKPINKAMVSTLDSADITRSNFLGYFQVETESVIEISHIGYQAIRFRLASETPKIALKMTPVLTRLEPIIIENDKKLTENEIMPIDTMLVDSLLDESHLALFPGGVESFQNYLMKKLKRIDSSLIVEFPVAVIFSVEESGNVSIDSISNSHESLRMVLEEVFHNSPKWVPAKQKKLPTRSIYMQEIVFGPENVYTIIETPPKFPGGMQAFYEYVTKNIQYPPEAIKMGIEGKVYVQFIVDRLGYLEDIMVVKGIGFGCDVEAERLIRNSPRFIPGNQKGRLVKVRMVIPIIFRLSKGVYQEPSNEYLSIQEYLGKNMDYPREARRFGITGQTFVIFELNKQRNEIKSFEFFNDLGGGISEEIKKRMELAPPYLFSELKEGPKYVLPVALFFGDQKKIKEVSFTNTEELTELTEVVITAFGIERPPKKNRSNAKEDSDMSNIVKTSSFSRNKTVITIGKDSGIRTNQRKFETFDDLLNHGKGYSQVSLVGKGIKDIPDRIAEFKSIYYLNLENNLIQSLPDILCEMDELEEIYLPENQIALLPDNFGNLSNLRVLSLAANQFQFFPLQITQLKKLEALDLGHNKIAEIPESIGQMKKLKLLVLSNNDISQLPESIYDLRLDELHVSNNSLTEVQLNQLKSRMKKTMVIVD